MSDAQQEALRLAKGAGFQYFTMTTLDRYARLIALARQPAAQSEGAAKYPLRLDPNMQPGVVRFEPAMQPGVVLFEPAEQSTDKDARIAELERELRLAIGSKEQAWALLKATQEAAEQRVAALKAQIKAAQEGMVMVPRDLLQCWRDYWNGDYNEKANFNAIDFVMGQFDDAITAAGKP